MSVYLTLLLKSVRLNFLWITFISVIVVTIAIVSLNTYEVLCNKGENLEENPYLFPHHCKLKKLLQDFKET